jgi:hypothetical protein
LRRHLPERKILLQFQRPATPELFLYFSWLRRFTPVFTLLFVHPAKELLFSGLFLFIEPEIACLLAFILAITHNFVSAGHCAV